MTIVPVHHAFAVFLASIPATAASPQVPQPSVTVTLTTVAAQSWERVVEGSGSIVGWQQLQVAAGIAGYAIVDVPVEEGDRVSKGQLLAQLDDRILAAQLNRRKAEVTAAEANLAIARVNLQRSATLRTKATNGAAEERSATILSSIAQLDAAKAWRDETAAQLSMTRIVAPADGTIVKRTAPTGHVVSQTGEELFRLLRDGRLELDAQVPEGELGRVHPGQKVRIIHGDDRVSEAAVRLVAPEVDPATRLGIVHVALPTGTALGLGMAAQVEIVTGTDALLAVPETAVVRADGRTGVFAFVNPNRIVYGPIKARLRRDGWVEVTEGLAAGDRVVTAAAGLLLLQRGERVHIETGPTK